MTRTLKNNITGWVFILPTLVCFTITLMIPITRGILLSFFKADALSKTFIGLSNYTYIFQNKLFLKALKNTFHYAILIAPPATILPLLLAIGAFRMGQRMQTFLRFAYYLPYIATGIVMAMIWKWLFHPDGGLFNFVWTILGRENTTWLGENPNSFYAVCIVVIAGGIGKPFIYYMASLTAIPAELYDAARIDGCARWQETRFITIPLLLPIIAFIAIIETRAAFQIWATIYVMTAGGPAHGTTSIFFQVYQDAFIYSKYGLASTKAVILLLIILILATIQRKYFLYKEAA